MPPLGRELFARDFAMTPGGGALITAAHLSASGRNTALLARFGTDSLSVALSDQIEGLGLDLQFLDRHDSAGPQLTVVMVNDSDRAFLSRRAGHARPASFEQALIWPEAAHLHIAEYATLYEMRDAISAAKAKGLTVSLDPSWDDELIRDPLFFERTIGTDIFMPNLEEAHALTGHDDPREALAVLARHFPIVALKCGGDGAMLAIGETVISLPSPQVRVIDTTGAGDAFNAACLVAAIGAGSRSVQAAGGTGSLAAIA
jgi:sugar/nucleoside kinase (ribokinase family)